MAVGEKVGEGGVRKVESGQPVEGKDESGQGGWSATGKKRGMQYEASQETHS